MKKMERRNKRKVTEQKMREWKILRKLKQKKREKKGKLEEQEGETKREKKERAKGDKKEVIFKVNDIFF